MASKKWISLQTPENSGIFYLPKFSLRNTITVELSIGLGGKMSKQSQVMIFIIGLTCSFLVIWLQDSISPFIPKPEPIEVMKALLILNVFYGLPVIFIEKISGSFASIYMARFFLGIFMGQNIGFYIWLYTR